MGSKTLWDHPLGMLMASGSPGSALAYHLGVTVFKADMARRNTATEAGSETPDRVVATARMPWISGWIDRMFDRLETWSWERERRAREAYLARSQDLKDLEERMRQLDSGTLARGRALY